MSKIREWESGYWAVPEETAKKLVGGDIFLHEKQKSPSFWGGKILGYRIYDGGGQEDYKGRIIFRFLPTREHKGVTADGDWNWEKLLHEYAIHLIHKKGDDNEGLLESIKP